jgi:hypothetical protein
VLIAMLWMYPVALAKTIDITDPAEGTTLQGSVGVQKAIPSVLERIAICESRNVATAKNPASSASGRFQITRGSWEAYGTLLWGSTKGHEVFNYQDNTDLAVFMYEKEGTSPWRDSAYCWE